MTFGLDANGLEIKRTADVKAEIEEAFKATFGQAINLDPRSIPGQIIGIVSERAGSVWELIEQIYYSQYPDTSEGTSLDNVSAITGTTRKTSTKSTAVATLIGTAGTLIPSGSVVSVLGDEDARFITKANATILAGTNEVQTITFGATPVSGSWRLTLDGQETAAFDETAIASEIELALEALDSMDQCSVSGNFATGFVITFQGLNGLKPQSALIVSENTLLDGGASPVTVTVTETTPGVYPQVDVEVIAENTGEILAPAGTLTVIETPISGWASVTNALDAEAGSDVETDQALKIRRLSEIAIAGKATLEAIRSALIAITDVTAVVVFQNIYAIEDNEGRPPKSLDIVVEGGTDVEIAQTIFDTIAGGIETIGAITEIVNDSQGFDQTIKFSRPTNVEIYLEVDLTVDNNLFPVDGTTQIEALILVYGDGIGIGNDVIVYPQLLCAFATIPGILDVAITIGTAAKPADGSAVVTAADNGGNLELTATSHGLLVNNKVTFSSTTTLPTGLSTGIVYHVVAATANTFQVATTRGGDPIGYTDAGTGTHTVFYGGRDDNIAIEAREVAKFDSGRTTVTVV